MASHKLKRCALRLPVREKCPPSDTTRFFPGRHFRFVVMENDARRIWNGERGHSLIRGGPSGLPLGAFDQLLLVTAIPDFFSRPNNTQPSQRNTLIGKEF